MEVVAAIAVVLAVAGALVAAKRGRSAALRLDASRLYPKGDPTSDRERLKEWWTLEFEIAGVPGPAEVEHEPFKLAPSRWSGLKPAFQRVLFRWSQVPTPAVYRTKVPSVPGALEALVYATREGTITRVVYLATITGRVAGEVVFQARRFEGSGADILNGDESVLAAVQSALSSSYIAPGGSAVSRKHAELRLVPDLEERSHVLVETLVRSTGVEGGLTFGLREALEALRAIERRLESLKSTAR